MQFLENSIQTCKDTRALTRKCVFDREKVATRFSVKNIKTFKIHRTNGAADFNFEFSLHGNSFIYVPAHASETRHSRKLMFSVMPSLIGRFSQSFWRFCAITYCCSPSKIHRFRARILGLPQLPKPQAIVRDAYRLPWKLFPRRKNKSLLLKRPCLAA